MIRLMLVDDHAMLREGLRSKFGANDDIKVIAEAGSAKELMDGLKEASPDVIILDMKLPDANGLAVLRQVKDALSSCKIVVLTMYDHVR